MYYSLFNEVSKAIELLKNAQCKSEEQYMSAQDNIVLLDRTTNDEKS